MHLLESGEMYIETIHVLSKKGGVVRSVDVSEHMGVSKPSVSRAIGLLKEGGYVTMARDGALTLTEAGVEVANKIYERHRVITALLCALGVDPAVAADDACRIEHVISDETVQRLESFIGCHVCDVDGENASR